MSQCESPIVRLGVDVLIKFLIRQQFFVTEVAEIDVVIIVLKES